MRMTRKVCMLLALLTVLTAPLSMSATPLIARAEDEASTQEPAQTPLSPPASEPTEAPTPTSTPIPTATPTPSATPTPTATPTSSATPTPINTTTTTPDATPTPTNTGTPTQMPTESPTPTPIPYEVTFTTRDAVITQWTAQDTDTESVFTFENAVSSSYVNKLLLTYVAAKDENNDPVDTYVYDRNGFSPYTPGIYNIVFIAHHPMSGGAYFAECAITVKAAEPEPEEEEVVPFVIDQSSNARYRKYLSYRNSIQEKLSSIMDKLDADFNERVQMIVSAFPDVENVRFARMTTVEQDEGDEEEDYELVYVDEPEVRNWSQVLPVFVATSSMKVKVPLDLYNLRMLTLEPITNVFWDMHEWSYVRDGDTLTLAFRELSLDEMIERYKLDAATVNKLEELMQPEFQMLFAALTKDDTFADLSDSDVAAIRSSLPNGITMQREQVVLTAHSLVGQLKYFWGGKYTGIGWNPLWGVDRVVESENSETYGTVRPYGMDCSGYVAWVFINAVKDSGVAEALGTGTSTQWAKSRPLGWDEAQVGDIAFFTTPGKKNHVGIVVEKRADGTYLVAHCSSVRNTVVITEAWSSGFRYMRRPALYNDA